MSEEKKNLFYIKKRNLLLIAGIVWMIAGFNVARLGILSYQIIEGRWYFYLLSVVVFCLFGFMFFMMTRKHTKRIRSYDEYRPLFLAGILFLVNFFRIKKTHKLEEK